MGRSRKILACRISRLQPVSSINEQDPRGQTLPERLGPDDIHAPWSGKASTTYLQDLPIEATAFHPAPWPAPIKQFP